MESKPRVFNAGLLKFITGDVTIPRGGGHRMVIHICNDIGGFGAGVALAIARRWPKVQEQYRLWHRNGIHERATFKLGEIQIVNLQTDLAVVNMIAQEDIVAKKNDQGEWIPPIRYDAVDACLKKVAKAAAESKSTIAMPRIGCGLAGGSWDQIEPLIIENLINKNLNVTVYDFEEKISEKRNNAAN
jgi:O-acetyl-ADP-ribose deacetylase (regulator of RNase III)